ncbi:MAG: aminotransferase class I/II-fold pyridoxal phosphate-dependent enzyme [Thermoguttaceae bacterium]
MNPPSSPLIESPPGAETVIDGRRYLYFVGTGYLGLQGHPEVIHAACEAARQYGVGSATTRAGYGTTPPLLAVERLSAQFLDAEAAFHFPSGYAGNQILVAALADAYDAVFLDELSHYCVAEAAQAGGRPVFRFAHCDPPALRKALQTHLKPSERPLVMTDGVFAARGDIAPLAEYRDVLADYAGATLLVDDAHGLGVLGQHGRGTLEEKGVRTIFDPGKNSSDPVICFCGTLSKALGGYGGIIAGSQRWVERLKTASHWYDGASPLPPPLLAASARALELVLAEPQMRLRLRENVQRLRGGLVRLGVPCPQTPSPIICLRLGTAERMRGIQSGLMAEGILIAYMAAYSGLGAEGALRLAVFATHTADMIDRLLDVLGRLI